MRTNAMWARGLCVLVALLSLVLIASVYRSYSPTWDEPAHIGNGMAWLTGDHRMIDPVDPPLARVATAVGPWLMGARLQTTDEPYASGNQVLASLGHYKNVLTSARITTAIFFLIALYVTWQMTCGWLGEWGACVSVALLAFEPQLLANASLATTDMASAAFFALALWCLWRVAQRQDWDRVVAAGVMVGLACSSKLSAVPLCLVCGVLLVIHAYWLDRQWPRWRRMLTIPVVAALTIWATYRFEVGPMGTSEASRQAVERFAARTGPLHHVVLWFMQHIPCYQFLQGVLVARQFSQHPPTGYLLGHTFNSGHMYFFLVLLLAKTALPLLLLGLPGLVLLVRQTFWRRDRFAVVPLLGVVVPIAVVTSSHVYIGLRHVLAVYPFLAMAAGLCAVTLWQAVRVPVWAKAGAVAVLVLWTAGDCAFAAPEFLPWYNAAAAPWATYIHVDSDYDWGQDLGRLPATLQALHADNVALCYSGSADPNEFGMPAWRKIQVGDKATGWVAVSVTHLTLFPQEFQWLANAKLMGMAGKTIKVYWVEPGQ